MTVIEDTFFAEVSEEYRVKLSARALLDAAETLMDRGVCWDKTNMERIGLCGVIVDDLLRLKRIFDR